MNLTSRNRTTILLSCAVASALLSVHCGSSNSSASGAQTTTHPGTSPSSTSSSSRPSVPVAGDGGSSSGVVGAIAGGVSTTLPKLPQLTNVVATEDDDSVSITFDPFDGALDYRVYPLPADSDIAAMSDGHVTIHNATYRCAGYRETPAPALEQVPNSGGAFITTQVKQNVGGYQRSMADATLGYVYVTPGPGLVPVYALGESSSNADDSCYFDRWAASRAKKYTTSDTERAQLLANLDRDDGIVFYVPSAADSTTTQIYSAQDGSGSGVNYYYFPAGPEANAHGSKTPAFQVLTAQAPGTQPLMRVFYYNGCGWSHDELAVGKERFNRAYNQGDGLPLWSLLWTGITGPTTLVVEALDTGCPQQGHLSPVSIPQTDGFFGNYVLLHPPYVTIDDVRSKSPTTEVFINAQHGPAWGWNGGSVTTTSGGQQAPTAKQLADQAGVGLPLPKAIARSFLQVAPKPHPSMDFFDAFSPGSTPETWKTVDCGDSNCYATFRQQSAKYDQMFINVESQNDGSGFVAYGPVLGEWWVGYPDVQGDTNGKYRLTANQKAMMSDTTFLHVTMEVDAYSTNRRYPQILISDQSAPVQYNMDKGHTLVVQPRGETTEWASWPIDYELQVCNKVEWDVNAQCNLFDLYDALSPDGGKGTHLVPADELGEYASVDHRVLWDIYTSTQRAYLFFEGQPYGCANLPAGQVPPAGPVTVTWGDVLYHSQADHNFAYHTNHMQIDTRRHFDNIGFSSGAAAPAWDETKFPCASKLMSP